MCLVCQMESSCVSVMELSSTSSWNTTSAEGRSSHREFFVCQQSLSEVM